LVVSERLYSKSCPQCGGICPLQVQTCRYCNASFPEGRKFSLNWREARLGSLRRVAIWVAILMIVVLFFINILRG
jgi:polyferredoxin